MRNETSDAERESSSDAESVDFQKLVSKLSEISSPEDLATLVGALRLAKPEEALALPATAGKEFTGSTTQAVRSFHGIAAATLQRRPNQRQGLQPTPRRMKMRLLEKNLTGRSLNQFGSIFTRPLGKLRGQRTCERLMTGMVLTFSTTIVMTRRCSLRWM